MGDLFKSKTSSPSYSTVYDPFSDVRGKTSDWLSSQVGKTAPAYEGQMVAPMSEPEKQSLDYLKQYTTQGTPESTKLAGEEVKKTLTGAYDPTTSPYYQAMKAEAARNLEDTLSGISSDAAGGGRYWSGARLGEQGTARTETGMGLNTLLGQMSESERARRLQAVPYAAALGQQEQQLPLQRAQASQQLGALPRSIDQSQNEAVYNEWLRQQQYPLQIAQLASPYAGQQPVFAQQGQESSPFSQIMTGENLKMLLNMFSKKTPTTPSGVADTNAGYNAQLSTMYPQYA